MWVGGGGHAICNPGPLPQGSNWEDWGEAWKSPCTFFPKSSVHDSLNSEHPLKHSQALFSMRVYVDKSVWTLKANEWQGEYAEFYMPQETPYVTQLAPQQPEEPHSLSDAVAMLQVVLTLGHSECPTNSIFPSNLGHFLSPLSSSFRDQNFIHKKKVPGREVKSLCWECTEEWETFFKNFNLCWTYQFINGFLFLSGLLRSLGISSLLNRELCICITNWCPAQWSSMSIRIMVLLASIFGVVPIPDTQVIRM